MMRPQSASALLRGPPLSLCDVINMGYLQHVRDLVDVGMDIDCRDVDGKTPLILCALLEPTSWGVGIARHLIELGANLKLRDKSGLNALHHAFIYERRKLANVLLRAIDFDLNQRDKYGNTALHYAVKSGNMDMIALIVNYLRRYSMNLDSRNKEGMSAVDIAHELLDTKCLQLLEEREKGSRDSDGKQKNAANDEVDTESLTSEKSGTPETVDDNLREKGAEERSEKSRGEDTLPTQQIRRSQTALLKRRRTSSSSSSSSLSSGGRSRNRMSSRCKTPRQSNDRVTDRIIQCVSLSDFRNTKEYVFKLTSMPYDELEASRCLPSIRRPQSAWTPRWDAGFRDPEPLTWRKEFKKLYVEYEFQCSPSWRDAAKTLADQIAGATASSAPEDEEEKVKERKGRRSSVSQKGLTVESIKDKRRSSGNIKLRKGSSLNPTSHSKLGQDGALASSSESLSSSSSSKKRDVGLPKAESTSLKNTPTLEKEPPLKGATSSMAIPAVTETLVEDVENGDGVKEDGAGVDTAMLNVLSDIDE